MTVNIIQVSENLIHAQVEGGALIGAIRLRIDGVWEGQAGDEIILQRTKEQGIEALKKLSEKYLTKKEKEL